MSCSSLAKIAYCPIRWMLPAPSREYYFPWKALRRWMCCLVTQNWALGKSPAQQVLDLEHGAPPFLPPPSLLSSFCTVVWTQVWPQGSWAEGLSMKHWCLSSGSVAHEEGPSTPWILSFLFCKMGWTISALDSPKLCSRSEESPMCELLQKSWHASQYKRPRTLVWV